MTTIQDTGKFRTDLGDRYYTSPDVATLCLVCAQSVIPNPGGLRWIEPAAGAGAFVDALKGLVEGVDVTALDIAPGRADIQKADFMSWTGAAQVFFGNPPFGRQAATARRFIGRAADLGAKWIAFILPLSFEKPSMERAFPLVYHRRLSFRLNSHAFLVNGEPHDVPCVFQVWERMPEPRVVAEVVLPRNFKFVKSTEAHDIVVRRVGVNAGRTFLAGGLHSPQSHYFIKIGVACDKNRVVERMNQHTFPTNTTGPRSLSQEEITRVLDPNVGVALLPSSQG
jgi:hypothetical protein